MPKHSLIAGDGKTNVYRANTLDPRGWDPSIKEGLKHRLQRFPHDAARDQWNREHFRFFDFEVLLTNPPFAGDIKDSRILHQYELGKKPSGKWQTNVGRDVLFVQRNLEFLKPGGRMAIVLPQGRMNNVSDGYIRKFIHQQARVSMCRRGAFNELAAAFAAKARARRITMAARFARNCQQRSALSAEPAVGRKVVPAA